MKSLDGLPNLHVAESIHPSERFRSLALEILKDQDYEDIYSSKRDLKREREWSSADDRYRFHLWESSGMGHEPLYSLSVCSADDDAEPVKEFLVGTITDNEIRAVNEEGELIDDADTNAVAAREALTILMAVNPERAQRDINHYVNKDFLQIAGAYMLSGARVEKRVNRAGRMRNEVNRRLFTTKAINYALTQFSKSMLVLTDGYEGELAQHIRSRDYRVQFNDIAESAMDRVFRSKP